MSSILFIGMENCGIYKITNIINQKCYIGSSKNITKRWYEHKRRLRKGTHHSEYLQRSFNKYGEENFIFTVLELCEPNELLVFEQRYFDEIKPEYIILKTAGRLDGYQHTEKTKQIIKEKRKTQKSKPCSEETKQKISEANKNRVFTDEHKQKLSQAHKGKILSDEHKNKIRKQSSPELMREKQKLSVGTRKDCYIVGFDEIGSVIYEFKSLKEAYTFLNIHQSTLWRAIKNKTKLKNLLWKKMDSRLS